MIYMLSALWKMFRSILDCPNSTNGFIVELAYIGVSVADKAGVGECAERAGIVGADFSDDTSNLRVLCAKPVRARFDERASQPAPRMARHQIDRDNRGVFVQIVPQYAERCAVAFADQIR